MRVGIDLLRIEEVSSSIEHFGSRYLTRVFTEAEASYCAQDPSRAPERFAARFAAKEAARKVLRIDEEGIPWTSIEVVRQSAGWCDLVLHGPALELARRQGLSSFAVSISHEVDYATAVVIAA
jgi:holo-[acyl-carrier protein] synthase